MKINNIRIDEARNMTEQRIQMEIGKRSLFLRENLGMDNEGASEFLCSVMNLGIALQEKSNNNKKTNK